VLSCPSPCLSKTGSRRFAAPRGMRIDCYVHGIPNVFPGLTHYAKLFTDAVEIKCGSLRLQ
jgi:hypothetical protein